MSLRSLDSNRKKSIEIGILPILVIAFLISLYPFLRFGGWWNAGGDTLIFTYAIRNLLESGNLVSSSGVNYPNGYGFQALSVFLIRLSGLSLPQWQLFGSVLLIFWMVIPAWLLYREWLGTNRGATLAAIFLFTQPELLFVIMRGTHEKFTRGLILLCLYLITYSLRSRHSWRRFAASVLAFYLTSFALTTFNNFFSTSFLSAVLLSLFLAWGLVRWTKSTHLFSHAIQRMAYAVLITFILAFIYTFYVYTPAIRNLLILETITDRVAALFLDVQATATFTPIYNPYTEPVFYAWVSPYAFLLLSLGNWILLLGSGIIWVSQTFRYLLRRQAPSSNAELLLWSFYGAFAVQGVLSVLADISGALAGNLQHRMFPTISLMGVAVIARWLLPILQSDRNFKTRLARSVLVVGVSLLTLLALVKATREPVLSNQWSTYLPAEKRALDWAERTLADRSVWTGYDRRLVETVHIRSGGLPRRSRLDRFNAKPETDNFLISELIRLQVPRFGASLPIASDDLLTYDNGQAQIYHRRPGNAYRR